MYKVIVIKGKTCTFVLYRPHFAIFFAYHYCTVLLLVQGDITCCTGWTFRSCTIRQYSVACGPNDASWCTSKSVSCNIMDLKKRYALEPVTVLSCML